MLLLKTLTFFIHFILFFFKVYFKVAFEILLVLRHEKSQSISDEHFWLSARPSYPLRNEWIHAWISVCMYYVATGRWKKPETCLLCLCSNLTLPLFPAPQPTHRPSLSHFLYWKLQLTQLRVPPSCFKLTWRAFSQRNTPNSLPLFLHSSLGSRGVGDGLGWAPRFLTQPPHQKGTSLLISSLCRKAPALMGGLGLLGCASHPVGKSKSREANKPFPLQI